MYLFFIFISSFIAGIITLIFSFGLNVILIPILSIFMSINMAIAFSGIVFVFYNFIRVLFSFKYIAWKIVVRFAPLALVGVVLGSLLLSYVLMIFNPKVLKIIIGSMLIILVILDYFKIIQKLHLKDNIFLYLGGFISGFAGGLTGFQGPFRVASLLNLKLDYQTFLATSTILGFFIDGSRVLMYFFTFLKFSDLISSTLLFAILGSVAGFLLFFKLTKKINMEKFKPIILLFTIVLVIIMILS